MLKRKSTYYNNKQHLSQGHPISLSYIIFTRYILTSKKKYEVHKYIRKKLGAKKKLQLSFARVCHNNLLTFFSITINESLPKVLTP